jgi:hypothetical protein
MKIDGKSVVIDANTYTAMLVDTNDLLVIVFGTVVPNAVAGFAKGCLFIKTDAGNGVKSLYENVGTTASCNFNLIGDISSAEIANLAISTAKLAELAVTTSKIADGAVTNGQIDAGLIKTVQIPLTAAQINGMYAAPVLVLAGIAGKAIFVDSVNFDLTGTATQFAAGGVANVQYAATVNGAGTTAHADIAAAVITGATALVKTHRIGKDLSSIATASIDGIGLYFSNKTGAFTTGTGTGVLTVRYHVV